MAYEVRIRRSALNYLNKLNVSSHRRLAAAVEGLSEVPPTGDVRPLTGQAGAYRLRVGGFRLLFHIDHQQEIIFVDAIGSRGDIYK